MVGLLFQNNIWASSFQCLNFAIIEMEISPYHRFGYFRYIRKYFINWSLLSLQNKNISNLIITLCI